MDEENQINDKLKIMKFFSFLPWSLKHAPFLLYIYIYIYIYIFQRNNESLQNTAGQIPRKNKKKEEKTVNYVSMPRTWETMPAWAYYCRA